MPVELIISNTNFPEGGPDVLRSADKRMAELQDVVGRPSSKDDVLALDWAGIGDACCHARLILQHFMAKGRKVTWITTPKVGCLFRDDHEMTVLEGFYNPFRYAIRPQIMVSQTINELFSEHFPDWQRFNISHFVMENLENIGGEHDISSAFFACCGMKRDFSIKHSLRHLGTPPDDVKKPYVVLEYIGHTTGIANPIKTQDLVNNLAKIGISTVCLGPSDGYEVPGAIMRLGVNLYDTLSIIKGSTAMVGRSSGNHALACFLPNLPVFEVDVSWFISHKSLSLHPNTTTMGADYPSEIPKLIIERKLV